MARKHMSRDKQLAETFRNSSATRRRSSRAGRRAEVARVRRLVVALEGAYGKRPWRKHRGGVDGLVQTILSQNTSDLNSMNAFRALKERFPTWESLLTAPVTMIERAIRPGGLSKIKAPRIKKALAGIMNKHGRLSLKFLARMPVDAARKYLESIDGVGPKTACCVLMFCYKRPALPVDTHVHRVAGRIGLFPAKTSAEAAHDLLGNICPPGLVYAFHMLMVEHGRRTCRARSPLCESCVLRNVCAYSRKKKSRSGDGG